MRYFEIENKTDERFSPAVAKGTNLRRPGGCSECSTIPKNAGPPEVLKVKLPSPNGPLSHTSWGFGVISVELLDYLGKETSSCLKLGKLADSAGNVLDNVRTFVGIERIFLRGNRESQHRLCSRCGALIYTYLPRTSPYLTPSQVASGLPIYEIESMQLLVNETIRERIGDRWSDALSFYDVPVLESPLDELPIDLGLWPTAEQLVGYQPNLPKRM